MLPVLEMLLCISDSGEKHTGCPSNISMELLHKNIDFNNTLVLNPPQNMHIPYFSNILLPNYIYCTFSFKNSYCMSLIREIRQRIGDDALKG